MSVIAPASIRVLPPEVAARIAAGEVIERPASVVRELLDNGIDAGAQRISLEIEDGGVALIRVTDDGRGIPPEEIELAFERHATSKISGADDLGHVHTLGFRGEALPSVAAAADVELVTRCAREPVGVSALFIDSRVVRRVSKAVAPGTSVAVRELFARLPARRKFLGSVTAETRQVMTLAAHYALGYPGLAFNVVSNGRRVLSTSGDGDLRHAFAAIYGADQAAVMLEVEHEEDGVGVRGLAGPPSLHRGNRSAISVFVNGRWVQSRPLTFAVVDAYQSQLPVGRHPVATLTIAIADDEVDVNVHPAKAEVRFRDERLVGRVVRHAVQRALEQSGAVAWLTPAPVDARVIDVSTVLRAAGAPPLLAGTALRGPEPVQARLELSRSGDPAVPARTHRETLPLLRVVGQMGGTYVVAEGPDGMYLLDQHAAHERVVYDRLVARSAAPDSGAAQPLLEPVVLELDPMQAATLAEFEPHLRASGLELEPFGERAYLVRSVPVGLGTIDVVSEIARVLEQMAGERRIADPFGRVLATVACHSSVRAGVALAMEEMRRLVEDLEVTTAPRTCPHGRPTLIHVSTELLERQFGRR